MFSVFMYRTLTSKRNETLTVLTIEDSICHSHNVDMSYLLRWHHSSNGWRLRCRRRHSKWRCELRILIEEIIIHRLRLTSSLSPTRLLMLTLVI